MGFFEESDEWRRQRLGKFTASRINDLKPSGKNGAYFGVKGIKYIREVRGQIITQELPDELTGIRAIEWGHQYEPIAIQEFETKTGLHVEHFGNNNPKFFPHPIFKSFAGGSPDGIAIDKSFIVEVKCPQWAAHDEYFELTDHCGLELCEPDYYAQIQFNMLCCNVKKGYFISYHPLPKFDKFKLKIIEIPYDSAYIDFITERLEKAIEILNSGIWEKLFKEWTE